jgi:Holliday junction DNA helicase RuvB
VFYTPKELQQILLQAAKKMDLHLPLDAAFELARRSRGTPRIALRLLRRVRDFAVVEKSSCVEMTLVRRALDHLDVDEVGLDALDRRYLSHIALHFLGGPVGIDTLAAALAEERETLEEIVEPFLIQQGFLQRTSRGRVLSAQAYTHLGLPAPLRPEVDLLEGS